MCTEIADCAHASFSTKDRLCYLTETTPGWTNVHPQLDRWQKVAILSLTSTVILEWEVALGSCTEAKQCWTPWKHHRYRNGYRYNGKCGVYGTFSKVTWHFLPFYYISKVFHSSCDCYIIYYISASSFSTASNSQLILHRASPLDFLMLSKHCQLENK